MRQPRSAKANPFPYRGSLVCYLSLDAAGSLTQVGHDFSSAAEAYRRPLPERSGSMPSGPGNTAATSSRLTI